MSSSEQTQPIAPAGRTGFDGEIGEALILADVGKSPVRELVGELEGWLAARVGRVSVQGDVHTFHADSKTRPDLVIVLGGDGAILAAVRAFVDHPVPTLGINYGRVGFLASAESTEWRSVLEEVLAGRAVLEPRMRLEVEVENSKGGARVVALNEAVLTRGASEGMLTVSLEVGTTWVTDYRADGLIVATPSGSTAYSLASGGPILAPANEGIVVTPICPQALAHRPIVLNSDVELALEVTDSTGLVTLVIDGKSHFPIRQGEIVRIRRHPRPYPLLAPQSLDPFKRLRDRLGWSGSVGASGGSR